ncbi:group I truncated hemoglobin [Thiomicrorhabdus xiamenensis]|uniref:Group 1 truncated hemoglobin n=1 Tax=Thiomicrorhabdus xiamenensis TaxID=2739063 RepID=A0A7D4NQI8_9GAMM|nr:group 1 truncated hemoglobin [Thiomicrorhabdus xiamenensis]QKI88892.1 group 1 truncated hemoglobin [Thiomicrorhabdus xiamenensis]
MSETLYDRLGGLDGITRLVDDIADAHLNNPIVKTRFEVIEDLDQTKQWLVEFVCAGTGGPQAYTGRDMISTHKGMNISEQEYLAVVDDIMSAMDKNQLSEPVKSEILSIVYSIKEEIIRV